MFFNPLYKIQKYGTMLLTNNSIYSKEIETNKCRICTEIIPKLKDPICS